MTISNKTTYGLLTAFVLLGALLRFAFISQTPPSLYFDEVSIGYNAYSILETGKDEHGVSFPIWFEAFGEYKLPVYIYSVAAAMLAFGKTELAVRFPSALAGTLSIIAIFFLAKELIHKTKLPTATPLFASFFFAISQWSLQFSRAGFEANLALLFVIAGFAFLLNGLRNKKTLPFVLSSFVFAACFFTYNSAKLFVPLMGVVTLGLNRKDIKPNKKNLIIAFAIGGLIVLPTIPAQLGEQGTTRAVSETYIGTETPLSTLQKLNSKIIEQLDSNFLFFTADRNGRHSIKSQGMLYYFHIPLIIAGTYLLLKNRSKTTWFLASWLVIATLPAAVTNTTPHSLRSLTMLPALLIVSAIGAGMFLDKTQQIKTKPFRLLIYVSAALILSYNLFIYFIDYHYVYPKISALEWDSGTKQVGQVIAEHYDKVDNIYVTGNYSLISLAYHVPIPPNQLHKARAATDSARPSIDKISFTEFAWDVKPEPSTRSLIVAPASQKPDDIESIPIHMKSGDERFSAWFVDTND